MGSTLHFSGHPHPTIHQSQTGLPCHAGGDCEGQDGKRPAKRFTRSHSVVSPDRPTLSYDLKGEGCARTASLEGLEQEF